MAKLVDVSGRTFRKLRVLHRHGTDNTGKATWLCRCDCGRETIVTGLNLKSGTSKSCGCLRHRATRRDLAGMRYGRLTAKSVAEVRHHKVWWNCLCDCGTPAIVSVAHLISGHTRSCGCLLSETSSVLAARNLGGKKESHPRWRHDLTDAERRRRRSAAEHRWSKSVIARENRMCVVCLSTEGPQAHHLRGYALYPEDRRKLDNGACLCARCHREFHRNCGQLKFSRSDFFRQFGFPDPDEGWPDSGVSHPSMSEHVINAVQWLSRTGVNGAALEDLKKARSYIDREIKHIQSAASRERK